MVHVDRVCVKNGGDTISFLMFGAPQPGSYKLKWDFEILATCWATSGNTFRIDQLFFELSTWFRTADVRLGLLRGSRWRAAARPGCCDGSMKRDNSHKRRLSFWHSWAFFGFDHCVYSAGFLCFRLWTGEALAAAAAMPPKAWSRAKVDMQCTTAHPLNCLICHQTISKRSFVLSIYMLL